MVTFVAALTLQSRRSKFGVACVTHYACLGDSRSVLSRCHCCYCCCSVFVISLFTILYQILFDFLNNFIFVFSVFLIFIVVCSIFYDYCVFVHYFSTALVNWYAYESCFVGSSMYYQLSLGVDYTVTDHLFAVGCRLFKHLLLLSASESGAVHCTSLRCFDFTGVRINFI